MGDKLDAAVQGMKNLADRLGDKVIPNRAKNKKLTRDLEQAHENTRTAVRERGKAVERETQATDAKEKAEAAEAASKAELESLANAAKAHVFVTETEPGEDAQVQVVHCDGLTGVTSEAEISESPLVSSVITTTDSGLDQITITDPNEFKRDQLAWIADIKDRNVVGGLTNIEIGTIEKARSEVSSEIENIQSQLSDSPEDLKLSQALDSIWHGIKAQYSTSTTSNVGHLGRDGRNKFANSLLHVYDAFYDYKNPRHDLLITEMPILRQALDNIKVNVKNQQSSEASDKAKKELGVELDKELKQEPSV